MNASRILNCYFSKVVCNILMFGFITINEKRKLLSKPILSGVHLSKINLQVRTSQLNTYAWPQTLKCLTF